MKLKALNHTEKEIQQKENTERFIKAVEMLKESGTIRFDADIVKALSWNKTTLSSVLNGNKPIPDYYYNKFNEVYQIEVNNRDIITLRSLIRVDAKCDVILSTLGEILSNQKGSTVEKINADLETMVIERIKKKLKEAGLV